MGTKPAGSVFWALFLLLFPVAVQQSLTGCVTYKRRQICGIQGSSVDLPCSFPNYKNISKLGWFRKLPSTLKPEPLKPVQGHLSRVNKVKRSDRDCTMTLSDLTKSDASHYYFMYNVNIFGNHTPCRGIPGVQLHIFTSPVIVKLEKLVEGEYVPVSSWTVEEDQRIVLTCVPTCAANLNSNPGYIWYKNSVQLNDSGANSPVLSLDPIGQRDTGSYVCAMNGHKDFPSPAVNLAVNRRPRNNFASPPIPAGGPQWDRGPNLKHNATGQISSNSLTPQNNNMFMLSIIFLASAPAAVVITIVVSLLILKVKKKGRGCGLSVSGPHNPNDTIYMTLNTKPPEYHTVHTVRRCPAAETVYEN